MKKKIYIIVHVIIFYVKNVKKINYMKIIYKYYIIKNFIFVVYIIKNLFHFVKNVIKIFVMIVLKYIIIIKKI